MLTAFIRGLSVNVMSALAPNRSDEAGLRDLHGYRIKSLDRREHADGGYPYYEDACALALEGHSGSSWL